MNRSQVCFAKLDKKEDESMESLRRGVQRALEPLGGMSKFVHRGARVLLKPNQTLFLPEKSGSTTSPRLIRTLIELAFEAGAAEVWVGEASGHAQRSRNVMKNTGMAAGVKQTRAHLIYFDEIAEQVMDFGQDAGELRWMPVPEIMNRADVIINVPKAKTHFVDPISVACKNWVGVMPMSFRLWCQRKVETYYKGTGLLLRKYRPHLTVVDGAWAGEGQGPGSNDPFWWGWIIASTDPVATDITIARLFGLDSGKIRMANTAADLGVGQRNLQNIEMVGAEFEQAFYRVKPADPSVYRFPVNVVANIGSAGATMEGTLGHWKTIADGWLGVGLWRLFTLRGKPTFMFGDVEDKEFAQHLEQGPYIVLDDAARDEYKYHPKTHFIPGSPVPQSYMQNEMVDAMGFGTIYKLGLSIDEMIKQFEGSVQAKGSGR